MYLGKTPAKRSRAAFLPSCTGTRSTASPVPRSLHRPLTKAASAPWSPPDPAPHRTDPGLCRHVLLQDHHLANPTAFSRNHKTTGGGSQVQETQMSQVLNLSCVIPCQGTSTTAALAVFRGEEKKHISVGQLLSCKLCTQTHCPYPYSVPSCT